MLAEPGRRGIRYAMSRIEERVEELGLSLPTPMTPPGNFELVTVHAGIAYVLGMRPSTDRPSWYTARWAAT
jgi:hypothetical protein